MTCKTVVRDLGRVVGVGPILNYKIGFAVTNLDKLFNPSVKSKIRSYYTYLQMQYVEAFGMLLLIISINTCLPLAHFALSSINEFCDFGQPQLIENI
jgi:hypothetical protein